MANFLSLCGKKKFTHWLLIIFTCTSGLLLASPSPMPWGKDADLAMRPTCAEKGTQPSACYTPLFGPFAEVMIRFHQQVISPADGPRSHFIPSSSQYTLDAMRKYGFFKGYLMGCDRLMRENSDPWVYRETRDGAGNLIKYDPVP